jgi:hypothetical protein
VPGIALPAVILMGAFLGAFNGGLMGLVTRVRRSPSRAAVSVIDSSDRRSAGLSGPRLRNDFRQDQVHSAI